MPRNVHPQTKQMLRYMSEVMGIIVPSEQEAEAAEWLDRFIGGSVRPAVSASSLEPRGTGARGMLRVALEETLGSRRPIWFADPGQPVQCARGHKYPRRVWGSSHYAVECSNVSRGVPCECVTLVLHGDGGERAALTLSRAEAEFLEGRWLELAGVLRFLLRAEEQDDPDQWALAFPSPRSRLSAAVLDAQRSCAE